VRIGRAQNPNQAVDVWLRRGAEINTRLFDSRSGNDVGASVPTGIWLVSKLLDLHDNLLSVPGHGLVELSNQIQRSRISMIGRSS